MTRAELLDRLDVLLGGRTAEEIIFAISPREHKTTSSVPLTWSVT